ncbi:hypothetical protein [Bradyrhizobium sp. STM 3557]|uniref:hypothetical protein n=1 Tax=Bradyrhizobium sp. STM 3557 TaxID=578920 RepID=UPI00388D872A
MPSSTYQLIVRAMRQRKPVLCIYEGFARAVCPSILGHKKGQERVLAYQFDGRSRGGLPPGGKWKCLDLAKMSHVELHAGPWRTGRKHSKAQRCVDEVDIDINPDSPYAPKRRLPVKPASPQRPPKPRKRPSKPPR